VFKNASSLEAVLKKMHIADSGATSHLSGSLEGMFNLKTYDTDIMVGHNYYMSSVYKGNYKGLVV
jgi:hypothetical protein